ncbi:ester cyclase [Variovorax sp. H27-G14]|uniref:ester cyclase n=1 Tax=Variovorax sp. H27-G14 TaxID=3111914 RepID=UPI0038FCAF69
MTPTDLSSIYRAYIARLNARDLQGLAKFVHGDASHNGRPLGVSGYREMLEKDFRDIPDLFFDVELLVCEPPHVASRIRFDCSPAGQFLGLPVNGRHISFSENVFYEFRDEKIVHVWSVLDKAAIEAQL